VADLPIRFKDVKILFLGVAFKRDVDDTRHSPAIRIMELLQDSGAQNVSYNDPFVAELTVQGKKLKSVPLNAESLKAADIVVLTTDHTQYDINSILDSVELLIDTRNATKPIKDPARRAKIRLLGSGDNGYATPSQA
jgi:UDP-N-acetyl-D-glucosamine dehydrogenase